ncbi:hypothetical protein UFOVP244_148 [uncultured Caudovirales phage]|uniref:Uncharacterized protein n=1 Tax=uncultured Caudovirales phage TaxID=2100421 RepID=A0A6J7X261_9CAUD|nr:hypothetical protein UFOVP244_148 [uncultured Caudovirales phage]
MSQDIKKYYECASCQQRYSGDPGRCYDCNEVMMRVVSISDEKISGYDPMLKPSLAPNSAPKQEVAETAAEEKPQETVQEVEDSSEEAGRRELDKLEDYYESDFPLHGWDSD